MDKNERQQSLANASIACVWLKYNLAQMPQEYLEAVKELIAGFEILDDKEQAQIAAGAKGKEFGIKGKKHGNKKPAPGKKRRGRPKGTKNGGKK